MQPLFLLMAFMFTFIVQMSEVVIERELKLRQSMATMGMLDSVHLSLPGEPLHGLCECSLQPSSITTDQVDARTRVSTH